MNILITGKGIDLTPAIEEYVHKKIGGLEKFYDKVIRAHVTVGVDNHHRLGGSIFEAECKLEVPGKDIFGSTEQKDLYAAINHELPRVTVWAFQLQKNFARFKMQRLIYQ